MISIIIPTLNEEEHLPVLLKSIEVQDFNNYEIIVADAGSKDKTIDIAEDHNCKIVSGGLPAKGRNSGASKSNGDFLLFLDADVVLEDGLLEKSIKEFERRNLKVATFLLTPNGYNKLARFLFDVFYNWPIVCMEKILAHGAMGILIDREIFEAVQGFDETIKLAEDHDLARRVKKIGKYGILKCSRIFVSDRRFRQDGWIRTYSKYCFGELYTVFIGPVRSDIFNYKFSHYTKDKDK